MGKFFVGGGVMERSWERCKELGVGSLGSGTTSILCTVGSAAFGSLLLFVELAYGSSGHDDDDDDDDDKNAL